MHGLHQRIYVMLVAFVAWFALAVWSFAGGGTTDYLLFIVCGFVFVAVALPVILAHVQRVDDSNEDDAKVSLHDWARADLDTWTGPLGGTDAAVQVLLPIAAAAVGMTAFGIIFLIAEHDAA